MDTLQTSRVSGQNPKRLKCYSASRNFVITNPFFIFSPGAPLRQIRTVVNMCKVKENMASVILIAPLWRNMIIRYTGNGMLLKLRGCMDSCQRLLKIPLLLRLELNLKNQQYPGCLKNCSHFVFSQLLSFLQVLDFIAFLKSPFNGLLKNIKK